MKVRRMRFACWIYKPTNTHSEYVILIAFPLQHWLHKSASMLCYTYIACLASHAVQVIYVHCLSCITCSAGYIRTLPVLHHMQCTLCLFGVVQRKQWRLSSRLTYYQPVHISQLIKLINTKINRRDDLRS